MKIVLLSLKEALKGENIDDIKKEDGKLSPSINEAGEAIYKSQQNTKPDSNKDDGKDDKGKKDDNVVDADFEEVKDENKEKKRLTDIYLSRLNKWLKEIITTFSA